MPDITDLISMLTGAGGAGPLQQQDPNAQAQPQAPQSPMPGMGQGTPTGIPMFGDQGQINPGMQQIMGMFGGLQGQQKDFTDILKKSLNNSDQERQLATLLGNSPDKRAKAIQDTLSGITRTPKYSSIPGIGFGDPTQVQTGENVNINKKQAIMNGLSEFFKGATQGKAYQTPYERAHEQALKEYTAETGPAVRELQTENMLKRFTLGDLTRGMGQNVQATNDLGRLINQGAANDTREQRANTYQQATDQAAALIKPKIDLLYQNTRYARSHTDAELAAADQTIEKTKRLQQGLGMSGPPADIQAAQYLQKEHPGMSLSDATEMWFAAKNQGKALQVIQGPGGVQGIVDKRTGAVSPVKFPGLYDTQQDPVMRNAYGDVPAKVLYTNNDGTPQNDKIPGINQIPEQYRNLINSVPARKPPTGAEVTRIDAAEKGYMGAKDMRTQLQNMSDNQFGTIMGNWNKFKAQHLSGADPGELGYIMAASILGANHSAAQSFRSAQFVDSIQSALTKFGTNKAAMLKALDEFQNTFTQVMGKYPETKRDPVFAGMTAPEAMRIYHTKEYNQMLKDPEYQKMVQAELDKRGIK